MPPSLQEQSICSRCLRSYYFCSCEEEIDEGIERTYLGDLQRDLDDRGDPDDWTQEDEDNLELWEAERRQKLAERNEY